LWWKKVWFRQFSFVFFSMRFWYLLLCVFFLFSACGKKLPLTPSPLLNGKVQFITGSASIFRAGSGKWDTLGLASAVECGDSVKTGLESQVEIAFGDSNTFRVGEDSKIMVAAAADSAGPGKVLEVFNCFGTVLSNIRKLSGPLPGYRVATPTATASIRGTCFCVTYELSTQNSMVEVAEGSVRVCNPQAGRDEVLAEPGFFVRVELGKLPGPPQRLTYGQWRKMRGLLRPEYIERFKRHAWIPREEKVSAFVKATAGKKGKDKITEKRKAEAKKQSAKKEAKGGGKGKRK
jgi:hypothetical protein